VTTPGGQGGDERPADGASSGDDHAAMLHRIRVGITGLAVVFLLTVLAAAMLSLLGQDDHGTMRLANGAVVTNGTLPLDTPKEPLAELGVAPGNMPAGNVATPAAPAKHAPVLMPPAAPARK
jgi:hypothetical protein